MFTTPENIHSYSTVQNWTDVNCISETFQTTEIKGFYSFIGNYVVLNVLRPYLHNVSEQG